MYTLQIVRVTVTIHFNEEVLPVKKVVVMKFGGTSVGDAEQIKQVARIVISSTHEYSIVVVVSAMSGVTDLLVQAAEAAEVKKQATYRKILEEIRTKHHEAAAQIVSSEADRQKLIDTIEEQLVALNDWLDGVRMLGELTPRARDLITSFGESLSIHLVAAALRRRNSIARAISATSCIITNDTSDDAQPDFVRSTTHTQGVLRPLIEDGVIPVVTGFMGASTKGIVTTLGRGGSDYSATILGYCLDAEEVWIWTDVPGVMTADPRIIPAARTIDALTYDEAAELSYFGAKVLHPLTMVPAALKHTPIVIKNTMNPDAPGTRITQHTTTNNSGIKAITSMKNLILITVQGKVMSGVPGFAARVFSALAAENISVLLISQASSQYNISLVVKSADGSRANTALRETFQHELMLHNIEMVRQQDNVAIVAAVGDGMHGHPGVAGKTFDCLGKNDVNVIAIAQGSQERNISLVINESDVPKTVSLIHDAFQLERSTT